jgi:hypothetical protein
MKRISGYISDELHSSIEEIAKRENRKFTPMIDLLLQLAVKEKNRKRDGKKVHTGRNTSNVHQNNG